MEIDTRTVAGLEENKMNWYINLRWWWVNWLVLQGRYVCLRPRMHHALSAANSYVRLLEVHMTVVNHNL